MTADDCEMFNPHKCYPTGIGSFRTTFIASVPEAADRSTILVGFASLGLVGYFRKRPAEIAA